MMMKSIFILVALNVATFCSKKNVGVSITRVEFSKIHFTRQPLELGALYPGFDLIDVRKNKRLVTAKFVTTKAAGNKDSDKKYDVLLGQMSDLNSGVIIDTLRKNIMYGDTVEVNYYYNKNYRIIYKHKQESVVLAYQIVFSK